MQAETSHKAAARVGAILILIAGMIHLVLGGAAILGVEPVVENVDEIESNPLFGELFWPLAVWGWIMLVLGGAQLVAASSIWRRTPNWHLSSLLVSYAGLGGAFFSLAIFRVPCLVTIVLLLTALWLLSYHSGERFR